jgi:hypothetical protein
MKASFKPKRKSPLVASPAKAEQFVVGPPPNPLQGLQKQSTVFFSLPSCIEFWFDA